MTGGPVIHGQAPRMPSMLCMPSCDGSEVDSDFQEEFRAAKHAVAVVGKTEVSFVFDQNDTDRTGSPAP